MIKLKYIVLSILTFNYISTTNNLINIEDLADISRELRKSKDLAEVSLLDESLNTLTSPNSIINLELNDLTLNFNILHNLADSGNALGIYNLIIESYDKEIKDKALEYLKQLAQNNNLEAQEILSYYYQTKEYNPQKIFKYASQAVSNDSIKALNTLGICYHKGLGTEIDYIKAEDYYLKSIYQNSLGKDHSKFNLALLWVLSENSNKRYMAIKLLASVTDTIKKALPAIEKLAFQFKFPDAFYFLGKYYNKLRDYENAAKYFYQAFSLGHLKATRQMALLVLDGLGITQSTALAIELLEWTSQRGDLLSNYHLGNIFALRPSNISIDFQKAAYFYNLGLNNPKCKKSLAVLYYLGYGVEKDLALSMKLWPESRHINVPLERYIKENAITTTTTT